MTGTKNIYIIKEAVHSTLQLSLPGLIVSTNTTCTNSYNVSNKSLSWANFLNRHILNGLIVS